MLTCICNFIKEVNPEITQDVNWPMPTSPLGEPTWSHEGILCTGVSYKDKVKLTFFKDTLLVNPHDLFIAGQGGGKRCAIDIRRDDSLNETMFKEPVREAMTVNAASKAR